MFARNRITRAAIAFALAAGIAAGTSVPAFADEGTADATVQITGTPLSLESIVTPVFSTVSIAGSQQTPSTTTDLAFTVSDLSGTGHGWTVMVEAEQLVGLNPSNNLELGSLVMTKPNVAAVEGTTSTAPAVVNSTHEIDDGTQHLIATAADGTGMGVYNFTGMDLALTIPSDVYADEYSSVVTITAASTP